jgi:hypothetical protein
MLKLATTKPFLGVLAAGLMGLMGSADCFAQKNSTTDILAWIGSHFEHVALPAGPTETTNFDYALTFEGCQVTLTQMARSLDGNGRRIPGAPGSTTVIGPFPLSALRPDTMAVSPGFGGGVNLVILAVTPTLPWISRASDTSADEGSGSDKGGIQISFATQAMAQRQAKAWRDAITSCGGKGVSDRLY